MLPPPAVLSGKKRAPVTRDGCYEAGNARLWTPGGAPNPPDGQGGYQGGLPGGGGGLLNPVG